MAETKTYTGEVIHIYDEKTFASGFRKRDLVLTDKTEQYPQEIPFSFMKDNCDKLNDLNLGDVVSVSYDLRGREWDGRHFAEISAWRVEVVSRAGQVPEAETNANVGDSDGFDEAIEKQEEVPF